MSKDRPIEVIARGVLLLQHHVLLCRSLRDGHAYLPGGHVERGESAATALAREFLEETGLHVRVGPLLLIHEHGFTQRDKPRHELLLMFHVEHSTFGQPSQARLPAAVQLPAHLPPVPSLEPEIEFLWAPVATLHLPDAPDLRPAEHAAWLASLSGVQPPAAPHRVSGLD